MGRYHLLGPLPYHPYARAIRARDIPPNFIAAPPRQHPHPHTHDRQTTVRGVGVRGSNIRVRDNVDICTPSPAQERRRDHIKSIAERLGTKDRTFAAFVVDMLAYSPEQRLTPVAALQHAFMAPLFPFGLCVDTPPQTPHTGDAPSSHASHTFAPSFHDVHTSPSGAAYSNARTKFRRHHRREETRGVPHTPSASTPQGTVEERTQDAGRRCGCASRGGRGFDRGGGGEADIAVEGSTLDESAEDESVDEESHDDESVVETTQDDASEAEASQEEECAESVRRDAEETVEDDVSNDGDTSPAPSGGNGAQMLPTRRQAQTAADDGAVPNGVDRSARGTRMFVPTCASIFLGLACCVDADTDTSCTRDVYTAQKVHGCSHMSEGLC